MKKKKKLYFWKYIRGTLQVKKYLYKINKKKENDTNFLWRLGLGHNLSEKLVVKILWYEQFTQMQKILAHFSFCIGFVTKKKKQ